MPEPTMPEQHPTGKLIVDARGTTKNVQPISAEKTNEPKSTSNSESEDSLQKGFVAAAGAVGGALVERVADSIEDAAVRRRVLGEIGRWHDKYEDDKQFGGLSYQELKVVITTNKYKGEQLLANERKAALESRSLRFQEATSYGVMVGADTKLRQELIVSEWKTQPTYGAAFARTAESQERDAKGISEYSKNPRVFGVVTDAIMSAELLARKEGIDLGRIEDTRNERGRLEERIQNEVIWNPFSNYAALIDQETEAQASARQSAEEAAAQRAHEIEMARAAGQADNQAYLDALANSGAGRFNYTVTREHAPGGDSSIFNDDFVATHGLPTEIFEPPRELGAQKITGTKMTTLLGQIFTSGETLPILNWPNIEYTIRGQEQDPAQAELKIREAFKAFNALKTGIIPLMTARYATKEGTFMTLSGRDGQGGVLNKGQGTIDMGDTIGAFRNDEKAKRALGILLAADGYQVGGMSPQDQEMANEFRRKFKKIIEYSEYDSKTGRPKVRKTPGFTQPECVNFMDNVVGRQIADYLRCDIGRVDVMVMLYTALGGGQRVIDYRELYQRFPVLRSDPKDVFLKPLLYKLKLGNGEYSFGYVEKQLNTRGVDGLFDALTVNPGLKDSHDTWKYIGGLDIVFSAMKKIEDIQKGEDSFEDAAQRRKEIAKLVDAFAAGDPPQFSVKTLTAIKQMPVYSGKGINYRAGNEYSDRVAKDIEMVFSELGLSFIPNTINRIENWFNVQMQRRRNR